MSSAQRAAHPLYGLLPAEVEGFGALAELALDMRWSWNHGTDDVWRQLDPVLWELTRNPWAVLQTVSRERLEELSCQPGFREHLKDLARKRRAAAQVRGWFQQAHPQSPLTCIAYFSMEFMLSEALPIYSGGLGNVAGDQLKAACDLGVPVIGVGLLYSQGYFRQVIDAHGAQQAVFPYNDPGQLPVTPLRRPDGEWLRLKLDLPDHPLWLRAWQVRVGGLALYLLDSNDVANARCMRHHQRTLRRRSGAAPAAGNRARHRRMAAAVRARHPARSLPSQRRARSLHRAGAGPQFHAAGGAVVRSRIDRHASRQSLHVAHSRRRRLRPLRSGSGRTFAGWLCAAAARIAPRDLLAIGRSDPGDAAADFNMAYLAMRGSGAVTRSAACTGG